VGDAAVTGRCERWSNRQFGEIERTMATRQKSKARSAGDAGRVAGRASPAHRSFIYKIGILRRLLDRYSGRTLAAQTGLTLAEWRVLTNLYSFSPTTSRQLCLRLHSDKAEVSRACAGLIAHGYASRREDPGDRRSALLVITPRGERLHDAVVPLRQAVQDELEAPLTRSEVAELHRTLDKLMRHVSERIGGGSALVPAKTGKHRATRMRAADKVAGGLRKPRRARARAASSRTQGLLG
jgi:DNA-binding MarR family transcriptional regulator